jgi:hypothetical protein
MCTWMATSKISRPLLGVHRKRTRVQLLQPCRVTRLPCLHPHWLHLNIAVRRNYSSPGRTGSTSTSLCVASTRLPVAAALHQLRRAPRILVSGRTCSTSTLPCAATTRHPVAPAAAIYLDSATCLGASARRAARHAARHTARRRLLRIAKGSSSTTSPPPHVWVPRHLARPVTRLVAPLVIDYFTSRRLVVDYSASRRLVVDYFASAARPGALAPRAARHAARRAARRRLLRLAQARRDCLSRGNTGPTSSTPRAATTLYSGRIASTIHLY